MFWVRLYNKLDDMWTFDVWPATILVMFFSIGGDAARITIHFFAFDGIVPLPGPKLPILTGVSVYWFGVLFVLRCLLSIAEWKTKPLRDIHRI